MGMGAAGKNDDRAVSTDGVLKNPASNELDASGSGEYHGRCPVRPRSATWLYSPNTASPQGRIYNVFGSPPSRGTDQCS